MSWVALGSSAIGAGGAIGASLISKNKKNKSSNGQLYEYKPYSGARPDSPTFTRETESLYKDLIFPRSQGIGVGYDPQRREELTKLVKNELAMQEEDQLRSAQGAISSSGLSGNPRAYEALAGRVKRDTGRNLENSMSRIAIEDLTRANEERDINTARVGDFNTFNFAQGNKVADFDLDVYNSEEGNRARSFGLNEGVRRFDEGTRRYEEGNDTDLFSDLGGLAVTGAGMLSQNPTVNTSITKGGQGIAPSNILQTPNYLSQGIGKGRDYRSLVR